MVDWKRIAPVIAAAGLGGAAVLRSARKARRTAGGEAVNETGLVVAAEDDLRIGPGPLTIRRAAAGINATVNAAGAGLRASPQAGARAVQKLGRHATEPLNQSLDMARDRLLTGLPEAADTKWRIKGVVLRAILAAQVGDGAAHAGNALHAAGVVYAQSALRGYSPTRRLLRETVFRLARSLDMESSARVRGNTVELFTTHCLFILEVEEHERPAMCEAVCGARASLFEGIAAHAGDAYAAPLRMGDGDSHCLRTYTANP